MNDYEAGRECCVCHEPIVDTSTIPTCRPCGMTIARAFKQELLLEDRFAHEHRMQEVANRNQQREATPDGGVVYYVRIEDYIKIGWTSKLRSRMRELRVDAHTALLAIEPGTKELERQRHVEFANDRIHNLRENFNPSPRLMDHTRELAQANRLPAWTRVPDLNKVTVRHSGTA